jgi:hypothetical protein
MKTTGTSQGKTTDRRTTVRKKLSAPVHAKFNLEIEALVTEISPDGMTIVFNPVKDGLKRVTGSIPVHLEMNGNLVSVDAVIRQISEDPEHIRLGISYDRSQIAVFYPAPSGETKSSC